MASITIRNLDEQTKAKLRIRAAHNNRSMEEEARNILRVTLAEQASTPLNLADAGNTSNLLVASSFNYLRVSRCVNHRSPKPDQICSGPGS